MMKRTVGSSIFHVLKPSLIKWYTNTRYMQSYCMHWTKYEKIDGSYTEALSLIFHLKRAHGSAWWRGQREQPTPPPTTHPALPPSALDRVTPAMSTEATEMAEGGLQGKGRWWNNRETQREGEWMVLLCKSPNQGLELLTVYSVEKQRARQPSSKN